MKKIAIGIGALALVVLGFVGAQLWNKAMEPSVSLSATSIQEQLTDSSELATSKLEYRGLVRYENGDIDFLTKKGFTLVYNAEVRAGVDLSQAIVSVDGKAITVQLPMAQVLNISIDPDSIEFYDESFAIFNWDNKQDTAEALITAKQDAEGKVDQVHMIQEANDQAKVLVENLLRPFTDGENAYTVTVVQQ